MSEQEPWVVVWSCNKATPGCPCWLMVNHIERGWELPGGKVDDSESIRYNSIKRVV